MTSKQSSNNLGCSLELSDKNIEKASSVWIDQTNTYEVSRIFHFKTYHSKNFKVEEKNKKVNKTAYGKLITLYYTIRQRFCVVVSYIR